MLLQVRITDSLEHGFVVLVYKYDNTFPSLLIRHTYNMVESFFGSPVGIVAAVNLLPLLQMLVQFLVQGFCGVIFPGIQIQVQNRILFPLLFQPLYCQSFKELLLPLEISLQSADQKTLTEPSRPAKKIVAACLCQLIYLCRLVHIKITVSAETLEILYPS